MKTPSIPFSVTTALLLGLPALQCASSTAYDFTAEEDVQAMKQIERVWSGSLKDAPFSISLCEDQAASDSAEAWGHVVKGEGRARSETLEIEEDGCAAGGVPKAEAFVHAVVQHPDGRAIEAKGTVDLGLILGDVYRQDWRLSLMEIESGPANNFALNATVRQDGTLLISAEELLERRLGDGSEDLILASTAASECTARR